MTELVFATNNQNKVKEIRAQVGDLCRFHTLAEIGCYEDIAETASTLKGNALIKAKYVYDRFNRNCFSEDTGLEVEALDWAPGVITARYAGPQRSAVDNMSKLLHELEGKENRYAQFQTVICLILESDVHYFTGICPGSIAPEPIGSEGFGYDPIFIPQGETRTFAQMSDPEKLTYSHRAKAMQQLVDFLRSKV
ncbi:MAG: RdgB/HAM1 family non-canonical purine NTP pyrophosphatase [Bacteroidota bacterium]